MYPVIPDIIFSIDTLMLLLAVCIIHRPTKLSLFAGDMILYIKNPKDSTKKLLELLNEFNKVTGYKVNIYKSVAFFIPIMKYQKGKLRKQIHLHCIKK